MLVMKSFEFDAGHRLMNHDGKCRNLHGHRYKIEVYIEGEVLSSSGMVMDFGEIKNKVKPLIGKLDHAMMLNVDDQETISFCESIGSKYYIMQGEPTAENIAEMFKRQLGADKVVCYETPTSVAIA